LLLIGAGLLLNATGCRITPPGIQLLPELQGKMQTKTGSPKFFLLVNIYIATAQEIHQLEDVIPMEVQALDDISAQVTAPQRAFDIDSLLHANQTTTFQ
jgi:hypothetical protein